MRQENTPTIPELELFYKTHFTDLAEIARRTLPDAVAEEVVHDVLLSGVFLVLKKNDLDARSWLRAAVSCATGNVSESGQ